MNKYQVTSVLLVVTGVLVSLYDPVDETYGAAQDDDSSGGNILIGLGVSVFSRLCSAINTILADR